MSLFEEEERVIGYQGQTMRIQKIISALFRAQK